MFIVKSNINLDFSVNSGTDDVKISCHAKYTAYDEFELFCI